MTDMNQPELDETITEKAIAGIQAELHAALSEQTVPLKDRSKDDDDKRPKRVPGLWKGTVGEVFFEPMTEEELQEWE